MNTISHRPLNAKLKNHFVALAAAALFVAAGALLGDPVPSTATVAPDSAPMVLGDEFTAKSAQGISSAVPSSMRLKPHLTMPYYSFARLLPRPAES